MSNRLLDYKPKWNAPPYNRNRQPDFEDKGAVGRALNDWLQKSEQFFGDHPGMCIAAGVVIGVALGCLVKRK